MSCPRHRCLRSCSPDLRANVRRCAMFRRTARASSTNERFRIKSAVLSYVRRQQPKGGDPVSHCLSPRSPASMSWIVTSTEVRAA
jgi:hypothetical protein